MGAERPIKGSRSSRAARTRACTGSLAAGLAKARRAAPGSAPASRADAGPFPLVPSAGMPGRRNRDPLPTSPTAAPDRARGVAAAPGLVARDEVVKHRHQRLHRPAP